LVAAAAAAAAAKGGLLFGQICHNSLNFLSQCCPFGLRNFVASDIFCELFF
jgi:hypothetical protein